MSQYKVANCLMDCKDKCQDRQHTILAVILLFTIPIALLFLWPNATKIEEKG